MSSSSASGAGGADGAHGAGGQEPEELTVFVQNLLAQMVRAGRRPNRRGGVAGTPPGLALLGPWL